MKKGPVTGPVITSGGCPLSDIFHIRAMAPTTYNICAGFYPNILRVDHPPAVFKEVLGGAMESEGNPARLKFFDRSKGVYTCARPAIC